MRFPINRLIFPINSTRISTVPEPRNPIVNRSIAFMSPAFSGPVYEEIKGGKRDNLRRQTPPAIVGKEQVIPLCPLMADLIEQDLCQ